MWHSGWVGSMTCGTNRRSTIGRGDEHGIALIWAILVMIIVFGTVAVSVTMTSVRTDETRDNANRTRSNFWTQAAADDLAQRLKSREVGFDLQSEVGPGVDQLWVIPAPRTAPRATSSRFPNATSVAARPLQVVQNGQTYRGWYQVLPIPGVTTAPWRAHFRRAAGVPEKQGSVEVLVRAWEEGRRAEPVIARLTYRQASFTRFSLLSDTRMNLGGVGAVTPGGYVHTNNAHAENPAITIERNANMTRTIKVTTTTGRILDRAGGCAGGKCRAGVRDIVEFGAAARAFARVRQLSVSRVPGVGSTYASRGIAHYVGGPLQSNLTTMPVWWVDVGGSGTCVPYGRATWPLRRDTVGVPMLDDDARPTIGARQGCLPISEGGGAILFNGDVIVSGNRSSYRPVTIMAQRVTSLTVRQDVDGVASTLETTRVTVPASIYIWNRQSGNQPVGSTSDYMPLGLVAEGGVYLPSFAMDAGAGNRQLRVNNVAAMAMGSEVSYGPSIISVVAESTDVGLGLVPTAANRMGYGAGQSLTWLGSIASRRPITFRYGQANGCSNGFVGYCRRDLTYAPNLIWNSPPSFPSDRDWHLADYREFRS